MLAKHVYPRIHNGWTIIQLIVEMHRDEDDQASKDDFVCDVNLTIPEPFLSFLYRGSSK
jgi:hypothetical protein